MNTIGILRDNCNLTYNKEFGDGETNFYLSLEDDEIHLCSIDLNYNRFDILTVTNEGITVYASLNKNADKIGIKEVFDKSINRYINRIDLELEDNDDDNHISGPTCIRVL